MTETHATNKFGEIFVSRDVADFLKKISSVLIGKGESILRIDKGMSEGVRRIEEYRAVALWPTYVDNELKKVNSPRTRK